MIIVLLLPILSAFAQQLPPVRDGDFELKLVHIVWRHGDRSPTTTFRADPFQEDAWAFGGGGFGQLSPLGMSQHLNLGEKLRWRYVATGNSTYNFLPKIYDSKAIYIRSTGINRTLVSAMSNMLGMYGQNGYGSAAGVDFPLDSRWPAEFVPVPIHTVDYPTDYIGNIECICPRREWLWGLAQTSDEIKTWLASPQVSSTINQLNAYINQSSSLEDFWLVPDALFIEQIYYNETLRTKNSWYTDKFYQQLVDVNDQIYMFEYGIFNNTVNINNLDIGLEMLKIRAGPIMNDIIDRIGQKSDCSSNNSTSDCTWINNLKYFAYSAHDETVYAVLVALGIEKFAIIPHGYPLYSAAVAIEYWTNTTDNTDYFRIVYHKEAGAGFDTMTSEIAGCSQGYCRLDVLRDIALRLKAPKPMSEWCQTIDNSGSQISLFFLVALIFINK